MFGVMVFEDNGGTLTLHKIVRCDKFTVFIIYVCNQRYTKMKQHWCYS